MNALTDCAQKTLLLLALQVFSSHSITVNFDRNSPRIIPKEKIELSSINVGCFLNDVVRLSAPMINEQDQYFLSKPNGETNKIELPAQKQLNANKTVYYPDRSIQATFLKDMNVIVHQADNYDVFKADHFDQKLKELEANEFLVGPLDEEGHGNWVLSVYTKDPADGAWIELFQVITMAITEFAILEPHKPTVRIGDTLNLSFAFPLPRIETCEIVAPRSTFDRFYTRSSIDFNKCGFTIPKITKSDEGTWKIIGVGKIIYEGETKLSVIDHDPTQKRNKT